MLSTRDRLSVPLTRRTLIISGAAAAVAFAALPAPARAQPTLEPPPIHPRDDWAQGLQPVGPLSVEAPEDVRFLLVHHSATPNGDSAEQIPARIRGFFNYHTNEKGWPDVAYNFFVDPYGGLWEGRQGSLDAPVKGDATGGSQGFALLICFIGDFATEPPTPEAMDAAACLLAWLASAHGIDIAEGSTTHFVSRGSSLWPAGAEVVTDTIAGHRDMSHTTCPGDALYPLVRAELAPAARQLLGTSLAPTPAPTPEQTPAPQPPTSAAASTPPPPSPTPQPQPVQAERTWVVPATIAGVVGVGAGVTGALLASRNGAPH